MTEIYEVALSEDGFIFSSFEQFTPGDVRELAKYVRFRVTVFGDFDTDDYRLRGFSGISDDATLQEGGFGLSPFGRFPFGDGGVCFEDEHVDHLSGDLALTGALALMVQPPTSGSISMSSDLSVDIPIVDAGSMAMSGSLSVVVHAAESGSMAMSGSLLIAVSEAGSMSLSGALNAAVGENLSGSAAMTGALLSGPQLSGSMALSGTLAIAVSEAGSMSMTGTAQTKTNTTESGSLALSGTLAVVPEPGLAGSLAMSGSLASVLLTQGSVLLSNNSTNGLITPTTTNPFTALLDPIAVVNTAAKAQTRLPIAISVQRITGLLGTRMNPGASVALRLNVNGTGDGTFLMRAATAAAPTAALAGAGAGNVNSGTHAYLVTFLIDGFETPFGGGSGVVTTTAGNGQVSLTAIPTGPTGTTARKIYRTAAGAATGLPGNFANYKLLTTINDNSTTTFTDNIADASLGAASLNVPLPIGTLANTLSLNADDLVCFEATSFVTDTSVSINNFQLAYSAATAEGFILSSSPRSFTAGQTNTIGCTTKGGSGAADGYIPKQLTIKEGTITVDTAPGAGASYTLKVKANAAQVGSTASVSGTNTSSRTTVTGVLPAATAGALDTTKANTMTEGTTGAPANTGSVRPMFSYKVDSPDGDIAFYPSGQGVFNWASLPGPIFPSLGFYALTTPGSTENTAQVVWPQAGTFKYLLVHAVIENGTTVTVDLRVNGVTVMSVVCAGTGADRIYTNLIDTAAIAVGDKVCFRYSRTAGAGTNFQAQFAIGYTNS